MLFPMVSADYERLRQLAERANRTPDLEWAGDLVHGLADGVLALLGELVAVREERDTAREALREIAELDGERHGYIQSLDAAGQVARAALSTVDTPQGEA